MGEVVSEIADLVFSLVIGYIGALEFLYVVRHLYHWSFRHPTGEENDADDLQRLQDSMRNRLSEAEAKEADAGAKAMQDGVLYKDGFRINPNQQEIDNLKQELIVQDTKGQRRKKIEAELARQRQIEEETRKQLEKAEAELQRERQNNEEAEQRQQQQQVKEEENTHKLLETERLQEEKQRQEEIIEEKYLLEQKELEKAEKRMFEVERERELLHQQVELEEELVEQSQILRKIENEHERKQKLIEENARKFLEAEQEMVELQEKMTKATLQSQLSSSLDIETRVPVIEEPCIKKIVNWGYTTPDTENERVTNTVKTQIGQKSREPYSVTTKPLLFPSVSDDGSSIEPNSSKNSSFSTQLSEEIAASIEEATKVVEIEYSQLERQDPDGEDNVPAIRYTDEYLRSLDGIKHRPLVREDGSGRRRAFKKRRSSGSSNSSRDSRTSREEEVKMFTSLEEEESQSMQRGESDYTPIKYTSEPTFKVKGHHRRHKRSPAKDAKSDDDVLRSSLDMLGEEGTDPWGEVVPEHYKDTEFWKREKAMSIDEEEIEFEKLSLGKEIGAEKAINIPKISSFEEATDFQNKEALSTLQKQLSKTTDDNQSKTHNENEANVKTVTKTNSTERNISTVRSSESPRLRRSPRIDEMDQYEERWKETAELSKDSTENVTATTPTISIQNANDDAPWRDEYGLIMQGLSDFYDFTASVNPSRSRTTSRQPSPVRSTPTFSVPQTTENKEGTDESTKTSSSSFEVYNNSGNFEECDDQNVNIVNFIESLEDERGLSRAQSSNLANLNLENDTMQFNEHILYKSENEENIEFLVDDKVEYTDNEKMEINKENCSNESVSVLVESFRSDRVRSRSRSRSPLPTAHNIERSLKTRREKRINQNDKIMEKLHKVNVNSSDAQDEMYTANSNVLEVTEVLVKSMEPPSHIVEKSILEAPVISSDNEDVESSRNNMCSLVDSLCQGRSRSRSRSKSPMRIPTAESLAHSVDARRTKLIEKNDEIFEQLTERAKTPEPELLKMSIERSRSPTPSRSLSISPEKRIANAIPNPKHVLENTPPYNKEIKTTNFHKITLETPTISVECVDDMESPANEELECSRDNMCSLVESLRQARSRSRTRSKSPMRVPTTENLTRSVDARRNKLIEKNDEIFEQPTERARTSMPEYCYSSIDITRSRTPSRSLSMSPEKMNTKSKVENEYVLETPSISDECVGSTQFSDDENIEYSRGNMCSLVESLRRARSRSRTRSKSLRRITIVENITHKVKLPRDKFIAKTEEIFEQLMERPRTPEAVLLNISHDKYRSHSPSRSLSISPDKINTRANDSSDEERYEFVYRPNTEPNFEDSISLYKDFSNINSSKNFNIMLNLEASQNKTLSKNSEELETLLAEKQRILDQDALHKLNTAREEVELRTLTPTNAKDYCLNDASDNEHADNLAELPLSERLRTLRCTPKTSDYDRTISQEWRDVQNIKEKILTSVFKRPKYDGESTDLSNDFEQLQRETAHFKRSQSPSPSIDESELCVAKQSAAEKRKIQEKILAELINDSQNTNGNHSPDVVYDRTFSKEVLDTQRMKYEILRTNIKRSTYVGESVDLSSKLEDLRREAAEFKRSRSRSRSPLDDDESIEIERIEIEAAKRELQDKILDEITQATINFQDFSRHLNTDFLDSDRRASDSALIQKPDISIKYQDNATDIEMDPEEYHHYRRYSLNQEQPIEEYPSDDYVYVSQIEVCTLAGKRTWLRADYYTDFEDSKSEDLSIEEVLVGEMDMEFIREDEYTDGSEDERQTVVEVEDEIDEDMCDFNERGPAEESYHEQSECEEAEREMDRYASREARDWQKVENIIELIDYNNEYREDEGAVGGTVNVNGTSYDSDSFTIDQIYDEAIKNRKQSGILRDYDSILQDMQSCFLENSTSKNNVQNDQNRYALWAKTRSLERSNLNRTNGVESSLNFLEGERRDHEMRYLGNANGNARQSARLRSRYGYVPLLQNNNVEDIDVDLNYKPRREYNWRKNFKIDNDDKERENYTREETTNNYELNENDDNDELYLDIRKYSLEGESITLFSRSPERMVLKEDMHKMTGEEVEMTAEFVEITNETKEKVKKPKKKKTKKKTRNNENSIRDEDDSENQIYSRRSSSIQLETDSPKRKSRSRRSSKSSVANDEPVASFTPRNSVSFVESTITEIREEDVNVETVQSKKKTKKRKKAKEVYTEQREFIEECTNTMTAEPISATISPESWSVNVLSTLSPQNSVCVTPASTESESSKLLTAMRKPELQIESTLQQSASGTVKNSNKREARKLQAKQLQETTNATTTPDNATTIVETAKTTATSIDNFDMLKDANFYPLF